MSFLNFTRPLLAGILHSFEPDHITAVSVLASEQAIRKKRISWGVIFRASQWALGHSVTLLIFGGIALAFKASLHQYITNISEWAEIAVGPIMILLGIKAIRSNAKINDLILSNELAESHVHTDQSKPIHMHGKNGEVIAVNPLTRSFWVGMIHGLAGTGGALTTALVISAATIQASIMVLVIESAGIILAMSIYSYVLISTMSRYLQKNMSVFKWINGTAGVGSATVGCIVLYRVLSAA
ncbi:MAG: cytochrome c biogenesis protein CcdA [Pedobacter sp.]|uniref:cytochrome c biogenesis protein CcdA n=1 Tax=Pedobacter sp. TaxID=1411316 RepID=UPI0033988EE9